MTGTGFEWQDNETQQADNGTGRNSMELAGPRHGWEKRRANRAMPRFRQVTRTTQSMPGQGEDVRRKRQ